jgi:molybdate transport system substrate-binding protein
VSRAGRFALLILAAAAGPLAAADVTVFAAASLADVLREVAPAWERATGNRVLFNFAGSNALARQIRAGAPADLFLPADEAQMDLLEKDGLLASGTRRSLLSNALVVVVRTDGPLRLSSARDLAGPAVRRVALADPRGVPAGVYAKAWLEKAGVWASIAPRVIPAENVRAALAAVESGDAEAGVVYATDARGSNAVRVAFAAPPGEAPVISYPVALVRDAPSPAAARAFLEHLAGPEAAAAFRRAGFGVRD